MESRFDRFERAARVAGASLMFAMLAAGCATSPPPREASAAVGTWRLVSFEMEAQASGERTRPMGKAPTGYLSLMGDGRMAVVLTGEARKAGASEAERAALYSTLIAYTGRYRAKGDEYVIAVDASANPAWVGTDQVRTYKVVGTRLEELTPWFPRADKAMVRVVNVWERVQ